MPIRIDSIDRVVEASADAILVLGGINAVSYGTDPTTVGVASAPLTLPNVSVRAQTTPYAISAQGPTATFVLPRASSQVSAPDRYEPYRATGSNPSVVRDRTTQTFNYNLVDGVGTIEDVQVVGLPTGWSFNWPGGGATTFTVSYDGQGPAGDHDPQAYNGFTFTVQVDSQGKEYRETSFSATWQNIAGTWDPFTATLLPYNGSRLTTAAYFNRDDATDRIEYRETNPELYGRKEIRVFNNGDNVGVDTPVQVYANTNLSPGNLDITLPAGVYNLQVNITYHDYLGGSGDNINTVTLRARNPFSGGVRPFNDVRSADINLQQPVFDAYEVTGDAFLVDHDVTTIQTKIYTVGGGTGTIESVTGEFPAGRGLSGSYNSGTQQYTVTYTPANDATPHTDTSFSIRVDSQGPNSKATSIALNYENEAVIVNEPSPASLAFDSQSAPADRDLFGTIRDPDDFIVEVRSVDPGAGYGNKTLIVRNNAGTELGRATGNGTVIVPIPSPSATLSSPDGTHASYVRAEVEYSEPTASTSFTHTLEGYTGEPASRRRSGSDNIPVTITFNPWAPYYASGPGTQTAPPPGVTASLQEGDPAQFYTDGRTSTYTYIISGGFGTIQNVTLVDAPAEFSLTWPYNGNDDEARITHVGSPTNITSPINFTIRVQSEGDQTGDRDLEFVRVNVDDAWTGPTNPTINQGGTVSERTELYTYDPVDSTVTEIRVIPQNDTFYTQYNVLIQGPVGDNTVLYDQTYPAAGTARIFAIPAGYTGVRVYVRWDGIQGSPGTNVGQFQFYGYSADGDSELRNSNVNFVVPFAQYDLSQSAWTYYNDRTTRILNITFVGGEGTITGATIPANPGFSFTFNGTNGGTLEYDGVGDGDYSVEFINFQITSEGNGTYSRTLTANAGDLPVASSGPSTATLNPDGSVAQRTLTYTFEDADDALVTITPSTTSCSVRMTVIDKTDGANTTVATNATGVVALPAGVFEIEVQAEIFGFSNGSGSVSLSVVSGTGAREATTVRNTSLTFETPYAQWGNKSGTRQYLQNGETLFINLPLSGGTSPVTSAVLVSAPQGFSNFRIHDDGSAGDALMRIDYDGVGDGTYQNKTVSFNITDAGGTYNIQRTLPAANRPGIWSGGISSNVDFAPGAGSFSFGFDAEDDDIHEIGLDATGGDYFNQQWSLRVTGSGFDQTIGPFAGDADEKTISVPPGLRNITATVSGTWSDTSGTNDAIFRLNGRSGAHSSSIPGGSGRTITTYKTVYVRVA